MLAYSGWKDVCKQKLSCFTAASKHVPRGGVESGLCVFLVQQSFCVAALDGEG